MIKEFEFFHGAAFTKLIHSNQLVSLKLYSAQSYASYIVNDRVGLYLKHSTSRLTPWGFSFHKTHQDEIAAMQKRIGSVVIGLVCNDDGIVGLNHSEFKVLLNDIHEEVEHVGVFRKPRQKYSVKGHDGKLRHKIGEGEFLKKVLKPL
jgi:hypothetical protein